MRIVVIRAIPMTLVFLTLFIFGKEVSFGQTVNDALILSVLTKKSYRLNDKMMVEFGITNKSENPIPIMSGVKYWDVSSSKPYCFDLNLTIVYKNITDIKDIDNIWTGEITIEPILIKIEK